VTRRRDRCELVSGLEMDKGCDEVKWETHLDGLDSILDWSEIEDVRVSIKLGVRPTEQDGNGHLAEEGELGSGHSPWNRRPASTTKGTSGKG
jgi:hypothetical protein